MSSSESNCFVCEERNDSGLRIPFFHDRDDDAVVATFRLGETFSGAPSYVHGGLTLAILDEAMAWAAIAVAGVFAVTKETTTRFRRPVRVGQEDEVRAVVVSRGDDLRREAEVIGSGRVVLHRPHLRRTIAITLAVGSVLFCINQLDVVLRGDATAMVWAKSAVTYLVRFAVSNAGVLVGSRRAPEWGEQLRGKDRRRGGVPCTKVRR